MERVSFRMRFVFTPVLILTIVACGGGSTPTAPATPPPTAAPAPTPSVNPFAAACGVPLPAFADSYGFGVKVQLEPSIASREDFDSPQRVACDNYLSGMSDQGMPGPNWFQDVDDRGTLVKCGAPNTTCELKPENAYLLDVYAPGSYVACGGKGSPGTCGVCVLAPSTWGVIHRNPSGLCGLS